MKREEENISAYVFIIFHVAYSRDQTRTKNEYLKLKTLKVFDLKIAFRWNNFLEKRAAL